jgi:hypothetical protein
MNKPTLTIIIAGSSLLVPSGQAFWGVGDIVSDPIVEEATTQKNIFDQLKYAWEQAQWADKLATLHNTLVTVQQDLQIAIMVKNAIGDPTQIVGLLDEMVLGGMLSDTGILDTLNELGGLVQAGGNIAMQLQYLGTPIDLAGWKNAARGGSFYAFTYNADPLAKYRAVVIPKTLGKRGVYGRDKGPVMFRVAHRCYPAAANVQKRPQDAEVLLVCLILFGEHLLIMPGKPIA